MAFRFRKFHVYQDAKNIHKELVLALSDISKQNYYIVDQIKRSSLSIVLNIAEGSSKQSDKDFNRFISIALGSVDETIACLEVALDLEMINQTKFIHFEEKYQSISLQLGGFSKSLKKVRS
jgi:four helix bundle protein